MTFTEEVQGYIEANKEELKESLLKEFQTKMIDIISEDTLTSDQQKAKIDEVNASLSNDFKVLDQPSMEFDTHSEVLSFLITRGTEFGHIRDVNEKKSSNHSDFDYITNQSSSDDEDSTSLKKEKQDDEHIEHEPRDPSIIIPV